MLFKINKKSISSKSWGDVDKGSLWKRLKTGLEESAEGVIEAIKEMYAVVKAGINKDLTEADCWGPHHEINQDGTLILSRGGLIAAAQALVGARSEPNLSDAQKREAAGHLLRHYSEIDDLEPPENLKKLAGTAGEMVRLTAAITGEMAVKDIPLAPGVDLAALKAGDDDPMEVVVEVPAGKSKRGWNYRPEALQKIVGEVMKNTLSGFLGHQKPEDVDHQFLPPVTHWVGAKWENGKAYFRGVIDTAAKDLKRWIRAGRIKQVSIFGMPTLRSVAGETEVVDYRPLSIDWTPLDRAGMPTRIVAVGEMDVILGDDPNKPNGGGKNMNLQELLAELRKLGAKPAQVIGEMGWKVKDIAGEMGWKLDSVAGEIDAERWKQIEEGLKVIGEMAELFGLGKDAKVSELVEKVKAAHDVQVKAATAEHDKLVDKVIGEMVVAEQARPLVKRMLQVPKDADEAAIKKAVGEMLEDEEVKKALAGVFKDIPITPKSGRDDNKNNGLRVKRVAI